jgi:DNA-binding transcriptional LysR family regulator
VNEQKPFTRSRTPRVASPRVPARAQIHANWVIFFHEVARCGSIRAASRRLNVAPSAISRQIKDLEAALGVPLLEKTSTRLRPTAAGEIVAHHVGNVLRDLDHARSELDHLNGLRRGHVTVVAAQATSTDFLPHAIAKLRSRYPGVSFDCNFTGSANVALPLIDGTADVGISFHMAADRRIRKIISVPLPFGIIVHPDHALAAKKTVRLDDLEDELVILPDQAISYRIVIDRVIENRSFQFRTTVTSSEPTFIVSLVRYGAGIAFGTPIGVERELNERSLIFIPLWDRNLKPPELTVAVAAGRVLSPLASIVTETFRDEAAKLLNKFVPHI